MIDLDMGLGLNPQPTCGVVLGLRLVAVELDDVADRLEREVEGELTDGLDQLPNVLWLGQIGRQAVVNRQSDLSSSRLDVSRARCGCQSPCPSRYLLSTR